MTPATFYIGAKALIVRDGRALMLKGIDAQGNHYWDVPGGRIGKDEDISQGLLREIQEEVPTIKNAHIGELVHIHKTALALNGHGLMLLFYKVSIDDCPSISLSDEHVEYCWVNKSELAELTFTSSVRDGFKKALELALV